jgi:DNA polymerase elongation subunit (family B)
MPTKKISSKKVAKSAVGEDGEGGEGGVKCVTVTRASVKRKVPDYSFRLLDFNIFDMKKAQGDDSDSDSDSDSDESGGSDGSGSGGVGGGRYGDWMPQKQAHNKHFTVQMFGVDKSGRTYSVLVKDFEPFFFMEVHDGCTSGEMHRMLDQLVDMAGGSDYYRDSILRSKCRLVARKRLYGFDAGKKYSFVQVTFKSESAMRKFKGLWYVNRRNRWGKPERVFLEEGVLFDKERDIRMKLYEANIPPLLRLFHMRNLSPSGWVTIPRRGCATVDKRARRTTCDVELESSFRHIAADAEREDAVPYKICSFDIEASSSHGDFPVPVKTYKRLTTNLLDFWRNHVVAEDLDLDKEDVDQLLRDSLLYAFRASIDAGDQEKYAEAVSEVDPIVRAAVDEVYPLRRLRLADLQKRIDRAMSVKMDRIRFQIEQEAGSDDEGGDGDGDGLESEGASKEMVRKLYQQKIKDLFKDAGADDDGDLSFQKLERNRTIVDVFADPELNRETKLLYMTKAMDAYLPTLQGDKVTFIGSTFMRYGEKEPYLNHCIALNTCAKVPGAEIEAYATERQVLLAWTDLIQRENPDIIIGYNIFGFDYSFMFKRATSYGQSFVRSFLKLSRNRGELCGSQPYDPKTRTAGGDIEIAKKSIQIASGAHELEYIHMNGRVHIDLYNYFRREYNLTSYKLDYVSGHFIGDKMKSFEHSADGASTRIVTRNMTGLKTGHYIHIEEIGHSSEYYENGAKFQVTDCRPDEGWFDIRGAVAPDRSKTLKWCLAKDDVTPQDIFRMTNEGPAERAVIAKYCIQDCNLVHNLLNKIDVITGLVEMANIVSVPIEFLVMRGQGIKLFSFIAKKCMEDGTLIPVLAKKNDGGYEGAIVLDPKCGLYLDEPVACVDYSSLYPSSMISENLSHDSKVWTREYNNMGELVEETGVKDADGGFTYDNLPGYKYVNVEYDTYDYVRKHPKAAAVKTKSGHKVCRFAQFPDGQLGILPRILKTLLAARKATRASAKWKTVRTAEGDYTGTVLEDTADHVKLKDKAGAVRVIPRGDILSKDNTFNDFMRNVLDKRQLAIKMTANSLYGQCGARTSSFYEKDVAASTTATGRKLLTYGKRIIEEVYGDLVCETPYGRVHSHAEYVYGDTDSVFMSFKLTDPETGEKIVGKEALRHTIALAKEAGELATKFLKAPHDLEYEKTFMPFCLLSKKRYVGMLYEEDPEVCYRKEMGIVLKRRDNAPIVKDVYGGVIDILMKEQDVVKAIEFTKGCMNDIIDEKYPLEKLIITKSLRGFYKKPEQIAHKVLADRIAKRDPGNKPSPGDRIPFVYIQTKAKAKRQGDRIETPEYIRAKKLKPDFAHYITNQIMKPVQQVFGLVLQNLPKEVYSFAKKNALATQCRMLERKHRDDPGKCREQLEKVRNKEVKALVFEDALRRCTLKKNNQRTLFSMW